MKPVRIGLLSDTHIPDIQSHLPPQVIDAFQGVNFILHAGDIYISSVLDELEALAPVLAAKGDDDRLVDPRVKLKHVLEIEGVRVGLIHIFYSLGYMKEAIEERFSTPLNVIVYGDTHRAGISEHDGILLVNPGSPTFPNYQLRLGSVGLLEIHNGQVQAHIVKLNT